MEGLLVNEGESRHREFFKIRRQNAMHSLFFRRKVAAISTIAALLLTSCAVAGVPEWVKRAPADKGYLYFVGIKTGARTVEEGKRSAVRQAITELVEHLEAEVKTKFSEKRTELEAKV